MTTKSTKIEYLYSVIKEMRERKIGYEEIKNELEKDNQDMEKVSKVIQSLKKEEYEIARKKGVQKLGIGGALLFTGFLFTVINFHSDIPFSIIMYSSSCLGISLLLWGLYDLVG